MGKGTGRREKKRKKERRKLACTIQEGQQFEHLLYYEIKADVFQ
jgi:hypothetical protein